MGVPGGQSAGSGSTIVLGSIRWVVRVAQLPGYAGPSTVDLELFMQFDVSG